MASASHLPGASGRPDVIPLILAGGKYALYIWPAYAVTALSFAWMVIDTLLRSRRWRRKAQALERAREE